MSDHPVLGTPTESAIRDELQELVKRDLLGPLGGPEEEFVRENPIDRYPLGRLAPSHTHIEPDEQDPLAEVGASDPTEADAEPSAPSLPSLTPSTLGLTAHVHAETTELLVTVAWGRYERARSEREENLDTPVWRRIQHTGTVRLSLVEGRIEPEKLDPDQPQVVVRGKVRRHDGAWVVSLFVENRQRQNPFDKRDAKVWMFQVELAAHGVEGAAVFLPRPERAASGDSDDQAEQDRLAMSYRFHPEFAIGSGTAVHATVDPNNPMRATEVRTQSMPAFEVPHTDVPDASTDEDLPELADIELGMNALAEHADTGGGALHSSLIPMVTGYREWIKRQRNAIDDPRQHLGSFAQVAQDNLVVAEQTADRIEAGITLLEKDPIARRAFAFANRAMHLQRLHTQVAARRRREPNLSLQTAQDLVSADPRTLPRWRPFQLAFVLLNVPALSDPSHPERQGTKHQAIADLLWFPTGGGKTEAYLGLTAYTIAIRRLQPSHGGLDAQRGVAVIMRYTLRLLTIQQFERATTLFCAAEWLRGQDRDTWGEHPFRIGLWVGGQVTPNKSDAVESWLKDIRSPKSFTHYGQGSPNQLTTCPWCGSAIEPGRDIEYNKTYRRTHIYCPNAYCPFGRSFSSDSEGLPVLVVDEEIYRHPPALLIGTVDKFAQLPWQGETSTLFGNVQRRCERHGYVTEDIQAYEWETESHQATTDAPAARTVSCSQLRPPDLIIQDELHLISGPLGSLVGLYESAVDRLASWHDPRTNRLVRPKIVTSTATVRRANRQIASLFNRETQIFPPPGLSAEDNFFARQRRTDQHPGRRYVGICAHGARVKGTMIRVYVSVLGAAQYLHRKYGQNPVTDPYMTLVGYFNSLRDLGGMRRLADDDVSSRLKRADQRGLSKRFDLVIRELTSRLSSDRIRPLLDQLEVVFPRSKDKTPSPVDVLLATNMIAVGVDVTRLGVMVVCNQPKSTAEYIQATSRVGRAAPGLVFTVYNWARPRDLSHYETFEHFHATMYRQVEALSVTPFAERAVDRGLTGVLVSLARELALEYNGNLRAQDFDRDSQRSDHVVRYLQRRAADIADRDPGRQIDRHLAQRVVDELEKRLQHWERQRSVVGRRLAYTKPSQQDATVPLLRAPNAGPWTLATAPTSLRDVEPSVQLLLQPTVPDQDVPQFQPPSNEENET